MTPLTATDPGSVGPYRLLGVLGSGGMGRVYLAESPAGRRVAIKVIRADMAADPVFRVRFAREVAAARSVSPLYTAAVVDADTTAPSPWFATTFIDGPSLTTLVETRGPLAAGAVLTLAVGLAEALASIHGAGLVHRDLTPGNIILDDAGPHIIDFGIAIAPNATKLTTDRMMMGTPSYIAPEVIEGQPAGPASDVFALGAILAFAVRGKHLVNEGPMAAQIMQIVRARFDLEAVPSQIRPLIIRCTAANPSQRPTAPELVRVLVAAGVPKPAPGWFAGAPPVPPIKLPPRPGAPLSRRRLLATAGVAGLAVAAAGAAALAGAFRSSPQADPGSAPTTRSPVPPTPTPTRTGPGTVVWQARSGAMPTGLRPDGAQAPARIIIDRGERLITANSAAVSAVGLDGGRLWTQTLPAGSVNLWAWGDGVVASDGQRLWLLDAASGEIRFMVDAAGDERADSRGGNSDNTPIQVSGIAVTPQAAYVGLGTAAIALSPMGKRLWRRVRPSARNGVRPAEGAPIAASDRWLVTHDVSATLVSLGLRDTTDGRLTWLQQYPPPSANAPAGGPGGRPVDDVAFNRNEARITDDHVVVREAQAVRVVALSDGETVWSGASPRPVVGMEVFGGAVLVAADRLRAYDITAQAQLWDHDARGARLAIAGNGTSLFVAAEQGMSLVDIHGQSRWFEPYPSDLLYSAPDWAGVEGDLGYVTFRPVGDRQDPLTVDVIAVRLGAAS